MDAVNDLTMCEKGLISTGKTSDILSRYFFLLKKTGYVKKSSVERMLVVLFILDIVRYMSDCITEEDYKMLQKTLRNMEGHDCLLPYTIYCTNKTAVSAAQCGPAGDFNIDFDKDFYIYNTKKNGRYR